MNRYLPQAFLRNPNPNLSIEISTFQEMAENYVAEWITNRFVHYSLLILVGLNFFLKLQDGTSHKVID